MGSKAFSATALFLSLNLLFFTLITSTIVCPPVTPKPTPKPHPKPHPNPHPSPPAYPSCPRDTLKLGVCADVLGLVNVVVGSPPTLPCCSLLGGLVDLEAAVCLCTTIKANVLGINLNVPVSLTLLLNACGLKCPSDFQCV